MPVQNNNTIEGEWILIGANEKISGEYPLYSDVVLLTDYIETRIRLGVFPELEYEITDETEYVNNVIDTKYIKRNLITLTTGWIPIQSNSAAGDSVYDTDAGGVPINHLFGRQNSVFDFAGKKVEVSGGNPNPHEVLTRKHLFLYSTIISGAARSQTISPIPLSIEEQYNSSGTPINPALRVVSPVVLFQPPEKEEDGVGSYKFNFTFKSRFKV